MKKNNTVNLQEELTSTASLNCFLQKNREQFVSQPFCKLLQNMFLRSGLSKAVLAKRSGTSEVYLYQIFSGARTPSRDRVLCLCIGLNAQLEQTQELLKQSSYAQLYVKNRRDAIIIYGLLHQMDLNQINDMLFCEKEATLC